MGTSNLTRAKPAFIRIIILILKDCNLGGRQLTAEYDQSLGTATNDFVAGDKVYRSRIRYVAAAADRGTIEPDFIKDGRVGIHAVGKGYEVAFFVRNPFAIRKTVLRYLLPIGARAATVATQTVRLIRRSCQTRRSARLGCLPTSNSGRGVSMRGAGFSQDHKRRCRDKGGD